MECSKGPDAIVKFVKPYDVLQFPSIDHRWKWNVKDIRTIGADNFAAIKDIYMYFPEVYLPAGTGNLVTLKEKWVLVPFFKESFDFKNKIVLPLFF